jgi:AraC-like DNA-binding protein
MYIEPSRIRQALDLLNLPFVPRVVFDDRELAGTVLAAFRSFPEPLPELESDAIIARVADHLVRCSDSKPQPRRPTPVKRQMEQARVYLDAEFHRAVSSKELEKITGLNRYSIAHQFRLYYGTSPYRYLMPGGLPEARYRIAIGDSK